MFVFRRLRAARQSLLIALREFCSNHFGENNREARGLQLLRGWLSPQQLKQFDSKGYFDVIGCDTGRRYRIYYGAAMNVHELDDGDRLKMGWCFVPYGSLVAGDVVLAQKIALETFESGVLLVAKRFVPGTRGAQMHP